MARLYPIQRHSSLVNLVVARRSQSCACTVCERRVIPGRRRHTLGRRPPWTVLLVMDRGFPVIQRRVWRFGGRDSGRVSVAIPSTSWHVRLKVPHSGSCSRGPSRTATAVLDAVVQAWRGSLDWLKILALPALLAGYGRLSNSIAFVLPLLGHAWRRRNSLLRPKKRCRAAFSTATGSITVNILFPNVGLPKKNFSVRLLSPTNHRRHVCERPEWICHPSPTPPTLEQDTNSPRENWKKDFRASDLRRP